MLFFELHKIMVNKVTFVGFREGERPITPLDPSLVQNAMYIFSEVLRKVLDFNGANTNPFHSSHCQNAGTPNNKLLINLIFVF